MMVADIGFYLIWTAGYQHPRHMAIRRELLPTDNGLRPARHRADQCRDSDPKHHQTGFELVSQRKDDHRACDFVHTVDHLLPKRLR